MCCSPAAIRCDATVTCVPHHTDAIADGVTLDAAGVLSHVEGLEVGWLTGNNPLTSGVITCVMIHINDGAATNTFEIQNLRVFGKDT